MKKIFTSIYLLSLHLPLQVKAAPDPLKSLEDVGGQVYGEGVKAADLKQVIGNVVKIVIGFVGIIFIVLIIWAGLQWMTSGGNEEKITKAKKTITNATVGLVLIVISYSIAYTITKWLAEATASNCVSPTGPIPC